MVMLTKIKVFWIIALPFAKHRALNFAASLHRKPASSEHLWTAVVLSNTEILMKGTCWTASIV
jgi:hypothetical protein